MLKKKNLRNITILTSSWKSGVFLALVGYIVRVRLRKWFHLHLMGKSNENSPTSVTKIISLQFFLGFASPERNLPAPRMLNFSLGKGKIITKKLPNCRIGDVRLASYVGKYNVRKPQLIIAEVSYSTRYQLNSDFHWYFNMYFKISMSRS